MKKVVLFTLAMMGSANAVEFTKEQYKHLAYINAAEVYVVGNRCPGLYVDYNLIRERNALMTPEQMKHLTTVISSDALPMFFRVEAKDGIETVCSIIRKNRNSKTIKGD
jgi:hypothetical protein